MKTIQLKEILPSLACEQAMGHRNLTLVPVCGGGDRFQGYLLAEEAMEAGVLVVTEVDEAGTVSELLATNESDRPILLLDGEELRGAKQNRILNTTVLLPAKSRTRIPVSCVEEGRWHHVSHRFTSGHYAPTALRQRKSRDVQRSLRSMGRAESDQGAVWECTRAYVTESGAEAPTGALSEAMETLGDVLARYQEALPYPAGACGAMAAVGGRFVAADVFDAPDTLEAIWPRLVASYAVDAERAGRRRGKGSFGVKAAEVLLEHVGRQACDTFDSPGLGCDLRFEAADVLGQALAVEKRLVHLSVFPQMPDQPRGARRSLRIRPPSERRPRRRSDPPDGFAVH